MTATETNKLIALRIAKSKKTLFEAEQIFKFQLYEASINRIFYSCFYMVSALLLKTGKDPKTHSGVRKLFHQYFVGKNLLSEKLISFFMEISELRGDADYEFENNFNEAITKENLETAKNFIAAIEKLISEAT
ncbi:MAG: HEPN domain-containing protein [Bacteroidia bacterium]